MSAWRQLVRRARRLIHERFGRDIVLRRDVRLPCLALGSTYGQWVVAPSRLPRAPVVFSIGVGQDVSFDLAMMQRLNARVLAFDPTPKSIAFIESQQLPEGFEFIPVGLADFDGVLTFRLGNADHASYSSTADYARPADVVECPVQRLETLVARTGVDHIDVLKLDIEGGEYAAIPDVLNTRIPIGQLLVELHYSASPEELKQASDLVQKIRAAGYQLFHRSAVGRELSFVRR